MVASGLTGDAIYVQPMRLALHFIFALGLLCYTFWFALSLLVSDDKKVTDRSSRRLIIAILCVLIIQLMYGALMAGHKAATAAPTWPDINGQMIPSSMRNGDGMLTFIENRITIHFIHRGLAYLLVILVILLSFRLFRLKGSSLFKRNRWWPLALVLVQTTLGVLTVLNSLQIVPNHWGVFEWLAQFHQFIAVCLLLSLVWLLFMLKRSNTLARVNPAS
jgi:cytochrome c oxidase assembly protein subunit 15